MHEGEVARIIGLAALVQYETARMVAENEWRASRGESLAYAGEAWYCREAETLRELVMKAAT